MLYQRLHIFFEKKKNNRSILDVDTCCIPLTIYFRVKLKGQVQYMCKMNAFHMELIKSSDFQSLYRSPGQQICYSVIRGAESSVYSILPSFFLFHSAIVMSTLALISIHCINTIMRTHNFFSCESEIQYAGCRVRRLSEHMLSKEQELLTLPEHLSSLPGFYWGSCCSIISCLCTVLQIVVFHFALFYFVHCIVCPSSNYGLSLPLSYLQNYLSKVHFCQNRRHEKITFI